LGPAGGQQRKKEEEKKSKIARRLVRVWVLPAFLGQTGGNPTKEKGIGGLKKLERNADGTFLNGATGGVDSRK